MAELLSNSGRALLSFVERVERLNEEKAGIASDIKEVYAEVKDQGFDAKIIRKVIALRAMDKEKRETAQDLLDTYWAAIDAADKADSQSSFAEGA